MIIRSTNLTAVSPLAEWCREYHFNNPWPADFSKRFAIGFYQLYSGIEWRNSNLNQAESFCGGALHFLMVCEALKLNWCVHLIEDLVNLTYVCKADRDYKELLVRLSRAQRMILYASQAQGVKGTVKTGRTSRYNPEKLCEDLCWVIMELFSWVPYELRAEGIEAASTEMTVRI